jgi:hypothetical protein
MTGFKAVIKPNVVLHVQEAVEINFELAIGSASESVTVEGGDIKSSRGHCRTNIYGPEGDCRPIVYLSCGTH